MRGNHQLQKGARVTSTGVVVWEPLAKVQEQQPSFPAESRPRPRKDNAPPRGSRIYLYQAWGAMPCPKQAEGTNCATTLSRVQEHWTMWVWPSGHSKCERRTEGSCDTCCLHRSTSVMTFSCSCAEVPRGKAPLDTGGNE